MADADLIAWPEQENVLLVTTRADQYNKNLCRLLKTLRKRYGHGVIITANRPYHVLAATMREAGLDLTGLEFVDCISALTGHHPPNEPGVTFIDGPLLLEMIALRAQQLSRFMPPGDRFLVLDSVSTLKLYNGAGPVTEMAHTLTTRMRLMEIPTAFLALDDPGEERLRNGIAGYCDKTVEL